MSGKANTPRATWQGTVSCGLVTVPVKLYKARDESGLQFRQLNSDTLNRVRQKRVDDKTGQEVAYEDIISGFEIAEDQYVVITEEELGEAAPQKTREIALKQFAKPDEIPHLAIKNAYYVGPNTGGGKAFRLLAQTMADLGVVGFGRFVMRTNEYLACLSVLDSGIMLLETLAFAEEIRPCDTLDHEPASEISEAERKMATQLVKTMTKRLRYDEIHDEHKARLTEIITAKAQGKEISTPTPETAPAADLLAALEQSLVAVQGEEEEATPKRRRRKSAATM